MMAQTSHNMIQSEHCFPQVLGHDEAADDAYQVNVVLRHIVELGNQ